MFYDRTTKTFDHATLAKRLDRVRENAPLSDPASGVAARTLIDNYRKLTSKDEETASFRRENRKIILWKIFALVAELAIYPETTLSENTWAHKCPVILALSQPGMTPAAHRQMVISQFWVI